MHMHKQWIHIHTNAHTHTHTHSHTHTHTHTHTHIHTYTHTQLRMHIYKAYSSVQGTDVYKFLGNSTHATKEWKCVVHNKQTHKSHPYPVYSQGLESFKVHEFHLTLPDLWLAIYVVPMHPLLEEYHWHFDHDLWRAFANNRWHLPLLRSCDTEGM